MTSIGSDSYREPHNPIAAATRAAEQEHAARTAAQDAAWEVGLAEGRRALAMLAEAMAPLEVRLTWSTDLGPTSRRGPNPCDLTMARTRPVCVRVCVDADYDEGAWVVTVDWYADGERWRACDMDGAYRGGASGTLEEVFVAAVARPWFGPALVEERKKAAVAAAKQVPTAVPETAQFARPTWSWRWWIGLFGWATLPFWVAMAGGLAVHACSVIWGGSQPAG